MNPQPQQNALDPQVVTMAKAIRQVESGGDFSAKGKSGELGAYQFTEPTWNVASQKYLGKSIPLSQATPEQQNEVAYKQIKEWKDKGYNIGQVASSWNAGAGEPDAYTGKFSNGQPSVGVNAKNVKFDVPSYAKSVATAYQKLKSGQQVGVDPNNPSSTSNTQSQPQDNTYGASFPSSPSDTPAEAGLKAAGNIPSSLLNFGKGIVNVVSHPIKTAEGIGNAFAGGIEEGWNALTGGKSDNTQTQTFDALKKSLYDRYGSLENAQKTATNDPMGFGADVLSIISGGAGLLGKSEEFGNLVSKVASPVTGAASLPVRTGTGLLGGLTGSGAGAVGESLNAGLNGIKTYKSFMGSLLGKTSAEDVVTQAHTALDSVVAERGNTYKQMLSTLGKDSKTYDISPIYKAADEQLSKFGITKGADGLDFSRSKFALDSTAQRDITNLYEYVKSYGSKAGDRTALGVDNLKQVLGGYYSPNSDYRAFVQGLKNTTRTVLDDAPGYTKAMKNYADLTETIKDIQRGLSLGDKATAETSFNKLMTAVRGSNPVKRQLLQELNDASGGTLIPKISGAMMAPNLSKGLVGHIADVGGAGAIFSGAGFVPLLVSMMSTSPKLVGALVSSLGLGAGGVARVMNLLSKGILPANAANRISPQPQTQ